MKKLVVFTVLLIMTFSLFSETVILKDGKQFTGYLDGKQGDVIYLQTDDDLLAISKSAIKEIRNNGNQPVTSLIWKKKDFMNEDLDLENVTTIESNEKTVIDLYASDEFLKKDVNQMTDREFAAYLNEKQVTEINGIRKTMWKMWGASIGASIAITIVSLLLM